MEMLCFDLDNTLVHSNNVHLVAFKKVFQKHRLPVPSDEKILSYFSLEASVMVKKLFPKISPILLRKLVKEHNDLVVNETVKLVEPIPGTVDALQILKKRYNIAIISNLTHRELYATLDAAGIRRELYDVLIGNDEVERPKPAPDEVLLAERLVGIKRGYMIGDSVYDIRAGRKAGLKTIAVLTGNHSRQELERERPNFVVGSVQELPKFL